MFNKQSRTQNVLKSSFVGTICRLINIILGFIYRSIFLQILSSNYLGINGLFSNILQILSFADLGISTAIVYRFYEPISRNDIHKVGQLMNFFKSVYRLIALVIGVAGLFLLPFLTFFIKDTSELPQDVNLQIIYLLFLFQTISSYLFVYKQTILSADQKQYISSLIQTIITFIRYILQIFLLVLTKNYTLILVFSIILNISTNLIFSAWVNYKYRDVFQVKERISKTEKKQILNDTKATLCHKIGGTVLNSTDNLVLSKCVGIIATGVYSNYSMILSNLSDILGQIFGSFTSSLGNAHVEQGTEQKYATYRHLLFGNLWASGICTVCIYNLLNDFISVWVGTDLLLDRFTVDVLCIQFFLETARIISTSYTTGCGLFVRDRIRPLIEALINIGVSIIMANLLGIAGVFIGTNVSHLCTVFWREPYLLYKYEFQRNIKEYWIYYGFAAFATITLCFLTEQIYGIFFITVKTLYVWILKAASMLVLNNLAVIAVVHKCEDFLFFKKLTRKLLNTLSITLKKGL